MTDDPWRVGALSVRGVSHERTGEECQDACVWRQTAGGVLVAAVADGAGTARLAALGATVAAVEAVEALRRSLGDCDISENDAAARVVLIEALTSARAAVEAQAVDERAQARDLACTLIVLAAGESCVACAQVGDGAAVLADGVDRIEGLTAPASGEYINETTFLISPNAIESAQVRVWRGRAGFVAMFSDGLQNLALRMPQGTPHEPFFRPLFRFVRETEEPAQRRDGLGAWLASPRVRARADDDLTLLVGVRL